MANLSYDPATRTAEVVWTTGARVRRRGAFGEDFDEELSLDDDAVDDGRMNSGRMPVLAAHSATRLSDVIGVVEKGWFVGPKGRREGRARIRFSDRPEVEPILRDLASGVLSNISVGYEVSRWEKTERKNDVPLLRAAAWTPLELSLVPMPADPAAHVRSLTSKGEFSMTDRSPEQAERSSPPLFSTADQQRPNPVADERRNIAAILTQADALGVSNVFARDLVLEGVSPEQATVRMINERGRIADQSEVRNINFADHGTGLPVRVSVRGGVSHDDPASIVEPLSTAWAHRANPAVELTGRSREFRSMRAAQGLSVLLQAHGERPGGSERQIVQRAASLTTSDVSLVLANTTNKAMLPTLEAFRSRLLDAVYRDTVRDYKTATRHRVGEFPELRRVREHGEYERGPLSEAREAFALQKFGRVVSVTHEVLVNDDLEAISGAIRATSLAAAALEASTLATGITSNPTMSDGLSVFTTNHGNVAATGGALSIATLGAGKAATRKQVGLDGNILNIEPRFLIVPAALETLALQLVSELSPATSAESNSSFRNLQVIVEPRLDATSATAWYLLAGPSMPSLSMAYLEGEENPYTEARVGFDVDAVEVKVRWSLASYWADFRPAYRNAGA